MDVVDGTHFQPMEVCQLSNHTGIAAPRGGL